jgi:hypothetical protein
VDSGRSGWKRSWPIKVLFRKLPGETKGNHEELQSGQMTKTKTPWYWSASELYRLSDRRFLAKLVPTFADRGCRVVRATDSLGR